ncbi:hypothetical protein LCGC14_1921120 [marine sediment metagenome]|uniref:Uncharacterized protein n=1 Tax=marine sediment metagenome TaxID=412755 RepID=A0A0F9FQL9_9ZZZZ
MYLGDFAEDATVIEYITTHDSSGGAVAPSSALEAADLDWYKDGSAFAPVGITMTSPFVSTGLHKVAVDTSNDGGDAWTTGSDYVAILTPDETVDGETVIRVVVHFSIENRFKEVDLTHVMGTILTEGAGGRLAAALIKFLDVATPVFTAESVDQTGDSYGRIGANGAGLSNINLPNQTMDITGSLSGAVGSVTGSVGSVVGAVGSVTGAVGSVTGAVGSVTAGVTLTGATIDSVWDEVMEVGITARQSLRVSNSFLAGETNGGGTVTIRFRDLADTLNRITMTVDADGDRSGVALNLA